MSSIANFHDFVRIKEHIGSTDAFGRFRTSTPFTLFDSQNRYSINNKFYSNITGTGTVSFLSTESSVQLSVTNGNIIRETKNVFAYQPGKSLLIMNSFVMTTGPTYQRVGYFNKSNGIFVERATDGNVNIILRNNENDTRVSQADWNTNKCRGLDMTKAQIFWTDIEWLGVGSVRTGFIIDGNFITAHVFHHANRLTGVYMTTAILPVRYEIQGSGTMQQICTSVISEGGYDQKLPLFSQIRGTTTANAITLATADVVYPLISIRLKNGYYDSLVRLKYIDILTLSNDNVTWYVIENPNLTGASWSSHATSTIVEVDTTATAITAGNIIFNGYATQKQTIQVPVDDIDFSLGRTHLASDIITFAVSPFANSAKVCGMLSWIEI
jgi:hypothetical protein